MRCWIANWIKLVIFFNVFFLQQKQKKSTMRVFTLTCLSDVRVPKSWTNPIAITLKFGINRVSNYSVKWKWIGVVRPPGVPKSAICCSPPGGRDKVHYVLRRICTASTLVVNDLYNTSSLYSCSICAISLLLLFSINTLLILCTNTLLMLRGRHEVPSLVQLACTMIHKNIVLLQGLLRTIFCWEWRRSKCAEFDILWIQYKASPLGGKQSGLGVSMWLCTMQFYTSMQHLFVLISISGYKCINAMCIKRWNAVYATLQGRWYNFGKLVIPDGAVFERPRR